MKLGSPFFLVCTVCHIVTLVLNIARELIPLGGGGLRGTLQQCAWPEALQSFLFALQWTILAMFSTNVTIFHHLISQAGWNRCNLSIYYCGQCSILGNMI